MISSGASGFCDDCFRQQSRPLDLPAGAAEAFGGQQLHAFEEVAVRHALDARNRLHREWRRRLQRRLFDNSHFTRVCRCQSP